ncbi:hypothetical protein DPMN_060889 [Dreissena polymorpha]|uniref:Uncharacterized protein n=1 Tax=Dreissena polymorpha TaxID=45954 RepID=A0A9D4C6F6_DREPO|nr:hypothetical protein DPMN_060889 [Dreissena polymorpha]
MTMNLSTPTSFTRSTLPTVTGKSSVMLTKTESSIENGTFEEFLSEKKIKISCPQISLSFFENTFERDVDQHRVINRERDV